MMLVEETIAPPTGHAVLVCCVTIYLVGDGKKKAFFHHIFQHRVTSCRRSYLDVTVPPNDATGLTMSCHDMLVAMDHTMPYHTIWGVWVAVGGRLSALCARLFCFFLECNCRKADARVCVCVCASIAMNAAGAPPRKSAGGDGIVLQCGQLRSSMRNWLTPVTEVCPNDARFTYV